MKKHVQKKQPELAFPIDISNKDEVIENLKEITNRDEQTIREKLRLEFEQPGANVVRAFQERKLTPFVWDEKLIDFYTQSDAFLFELIFWNNNSCKRRMRSYIGKYIEKYLGRNQKILCIGDGLGIDSFYYAQRQHEVTYYEVSGFSERFASKMFSLAKAKIKMVSDTKEIPSQYYDVIMCLDVLEHINDVPAYLKKIVSFLRPGGILIVHAPFYMIHPSNPTHLKVNRKYSGRLDLYNQANLKLVNGRFFWNPLFFEKVSDDNKSAKPQRSAFGMFAIKLGGLYLSLGRFSVWPFLWIDYYRKNHNREME